MDILRLNDANHHPAEGLQVAFVCPSQAGLTEKFTEGMIKAGGGLHGQDGFVVILTLVQTQPPVLLGFQAL
jgi:hypothetical protein